MQILVIFLVTNFSFCTSGYASHNVDNDGDQSIVLPCGQFADNVGTDVQLE